MKVDLHIHSNYSSGTKNVKELIKEAQSKGLDMIAITDHDTIEGYQEYLNENIDYPVIAGVELSTYRNDEPVHILGYFYHNKVNADELITYLKNNQNKSSNRIEKMIENLKKYFDIELDYNEIIKNTKGVIGRPHIAHAIKKKYGYEFEETFKKFLDKDSPAYVEIERLNTKEAIDMLHRNNAIAVLAHPRYLKNNTVEEIIPLGIDGIEVYYEGQNTEKLKKIAQDNNLLITGGSDYHGDLYPQIMGSNILTEDELNLFLENLK